MTTEREWARSGSVKPSRAVNVKLGRVQGGFALGLSRRVAVIYPGGRVIAWSLDLGRYRLTWGRVT